MSLSAMLFSFVLITIVAAQPSASIKFAFTNVHGDYMVLQRAPNKAQVYGTSPDINETVKITLYNQQNSVIESVITTVNANYSWSVYLSPQPASINGEEYTVIAQSASARYMAQLEHVLFGDVYICSGQSNMQFTVDSAFNAAQSLSEANNYPLIRLLSVQQTHSNTPLNQVIALKQNWSIASNVSLAGGNWTYFSAMCWFFGKNIFDGYRTALGSIPLGLISTNYGGTPIRDWMSADAKAFCPNETYIQSSAHKDDTLDVTKYGSGYDFTQFRDTEVIHDQVLPNGTLWNAMIYPFLPMSIKGAIWYQGESDCNVFHASSYICAFPAMIRDWRAKWSLFSDTNSDFPFGFVHLSTWNDKENKTCAVGSVCEAVAIVRHAQTANYGYVPNFVMPNTYLATAIDLGDAMSPFSDIHPRYKQQVAQRLANAALNVVYGDSTRYWGGPIAEEPFVSVETQSVEVLFRNVNEIGLILKRNIGFEVYDLSTKKWLYIDSEEVELVGNYNRIALYYGVSGCSPNGPSMVRYNFYQAPCMPVEGIYGCSVYDADTALPALPFMLNVGTSLV